MPKNKNLTRNFDSLVVDAYPADEPGAAVLVAQKGEIIYTRGQGVANLEWQIPIEPDMVFRLASLTKQFTAVAILILLEQGKLNLDEIITTYLPDYPLNDQPITIRHLLTHTSGIMSYTDMPSWPPLWRKDFTVAELIDFFKDEPMQFEPGEKSVYNNSGYILLGAIIEAISGKTYAEFIKTHTFEPVGMKTAVYDMPQPIIPRRVAGYSQSPNGYVNAEYVGMTQPYAAGSLAATVYDLAAWDNALYSEKLLKQETLALAYESVTL
ncbi:Beta-lactamase class C-like and penicillin binding proteins (PBPs) superfamily, partial [hydrothermal vent metagenome]